MVKPRVVKKKARRVQENARRTKERCGSVVVSVKGQWSETSGRGKRSRPLYRVKQVAWRTYQQLWQHSE